MNIQQGGDIGHGPPTRDSGVRLPQARNNTERASSHCNRPSPVLLIALPLRWPKRGVEDATPRSSHSSYRHATVTPRAGAWTPLSMLISKSKLTSSIRPRLAGRQITPSEYLGLMYCYYCYVVRGFGTKTNGCHLGAHVSCNLALRHPHPHPCSAHTVHTQCTHKPQLHGASLQPGDGEATTEIVFAPSRNGDVWGSRSWGRESQPAVAFVQ